MKSTRSTKAGYVDPMPIAQINFNYPSRWELDVPQLAAGGERKDLCGQSKRRVAQGCGVDCRMFKKSPTLQNNMDIIPVQVSLIVYLTIVRYILFRCKDTYVFI